MAEPADYELETLREETDEQQRQGMNQMVLHTRAVHLHVFRRHVRQSLQPMRAERAQGHAKKPEDSAPANENGSHSVIIP